jgi:hypothetical protein
MAVTQKSMRSVNRARPSTATLLHRVHSATYAATLVLAAIAIYVLVSIMLSKAQVIIDDVRYGRPRTTQLDAFVGHAETSGQPTHLVALNLNRQATIIELPGGDATKARAIAGPYLFGASEDLTPLGLAVRDIDGDGTPDLLLNVRNEQVVYLNKDGAFRLPTPAEQTTLSRGSE